MRSMTGGSNLRRSGLAPPSGGAGAQRLRGACRGGRLCPPEAPSTKREGKIAGGDQGGEFPAPKITFLVQLAAARATLKPTASKIVYPVVKIL